MFRFSIGGPLVRFGKNYGVGVRPVALAQSWGVSGRLR